jgi:hypothetical protein
MQHASGSLTASLPGACPHRSCHARKGAGIQVLRRRPESGSGCDRRRPHNRARARQWLLRCPCSAQSLVQTQLVSQRHRTFRHFFRGRSRRAGRHAPHLHSRASRRNPVHTISTGTGILPEPTQQHTAVGARRAPCAPGAASAARSPLQPQQARAGAMADLHTAARNGDTARMLQLVAIGADLNTRDKHARTPLHLAAWSGQTVRVAAAAPAKHARRPSAAAPQLGLPVWRHPRRASTCSSSRPP